MTAVPSSDAPGPLPARPSGILTDYPRESVDFGGLQVAFDQQVLRPRDWTKAQALWAAELLAELPQGPVLELCAGAGHIGLLAVTGNERSLVSVDINPVAAAFATENASVAGIAARVEVREGTLDDVLGDDERFALVIADPPWVPRSNVPYFPRDPVLAIDGGEDGLEIARKCIAVAERHVLPGGTLLLQLGSLAQVAQVEELVGRQARLRTSELRNYAGQGVLARLDAAEPPE